MMEAMRLVLAGMTPYKAAERMQIDLSTMYRSVLYKLWKAGNLVELRRELDVTAPKVRATGKKAAKFAHKPPLDAPQAHKNDP